MWIFKERINDFHQTWRFSVRYFLDCYSVWFLVYIRSGPPLDFCYSFSILSIHSAFFLMLFLFSYFTPKSFCFICIRLLVCPRAFSTDLLVEFSFVIFECPVLIILLAAVLVSFKLPFFFQCMIINLFKSYCQSWWCFSFLNTSTCCGRFFTCRSSQISLSCFL